MKVGDLVRFEGLRDVQTGIILGFDEDNDPLIRDNASGVVIAHWYNKVEVISESR